MRGHEHKETRVAEEKNDLPSTPVLGQHVSVVLLSEGISFKEATDQSRRERGTGNRAASVLCEPAHRPFLVSFVLTGSQSSAALSSHVPEKSDAFMYKFWTLRNHLNMSVAY